MSRTENATEFRAPVRILILGAGFGGIEAARALAKKKLKNTVIHVVTKRNHFQYYPGLYRIVTGASPIEACVPLSQMLPKEVEIDIDTITSIDIKKKITIGESGSRYSYDTLVIALGSETTYFNVPGLEELSLGFKSVNEALRLKAHLYSLFDTHTHPDQSELVSHFHILIVGGGASGVEVAGDLNAFMTSLAKKFNIDPSLITIDLIESSPRLVPQLPPDASAKILMRLRKLGINIFLNRVLMKNEIEEVYMKDMSLKSKTVIWTAGTQVSKMLQSVPGLTWTPKKRIEVDEYLHAKGHSDIFVIGDAAGTPYSGLAQTAIYDGKYVGRMIARNLNGQSLKPYKPKPNAFSIPVGINWGVLVMGKFRLYGILAYIIRHFIDFLYFARIVSISQLFGMFFEGMKYKKLKQ